MKNAYTMRQASQLPKVNAIDTIAAGDTFCGALAVMCAQKEIDIEALKFANAAAAIARHSFRGSTIHPYSRRSEPLHPKKRITLSLNF